MATKSSLLRDSVLTVGLFDSWFTLVGIWVAHGAGTEAKINRSGVIYSLPLERSVLNWWSAARRRLPGWLAASRSLEDDDPNNGRTRSAHWARTKDPLISHHLSEEECLRNCSLSPSNHLCCGHLPTTVLSGTVCQNLGRRRSEKMRPRGATGSEWLAVPCPTVHGKV